MSPRRWKWRNEPGSKDHQIGLTSVVVEGVIMPKFKVGDRVKPIGTSVARYMEDGIILRVILSNDGVEQEYDVLFARTMARFYETQLRAADQHREGSQ
jgi:hypothetical protein